MPNKDLVLSDGTTVRVPEKQLALWGRNESAVADHIERVRFMNDQVNQRVSMLVEMAVGDTSSCSIFRVSSGLRYGGADCSPEVIPAMRGRAMVDLVNRAVASRAAEQAGSCWIESDLVAVCDWLSSDDD
ncbi:hypothetical protein [Brevundimonas bullata]|uniref:hypothetical protein n=1 Tax=Brevundimonas bullata TaxID=13160 RepID=UPI0019977999|nr:hypothetical protein [Brevundimonas sp.]